MHPARNARVVPFVVLPLILALGAAKAGVDEGQWLPGQIRDMDWTALKARGMELEKDAFWHPERGGVLSAAVQIAGCSASFISPDGLMITNHHCGFAAVQQLSTPQKNLLRDGFVAGTREAELRAPGMEVAIVRRIDNVTDAVRGAAAAATSDVDRVDRIQAEIKRLVAEGDKEPDTVCSVASFLSGTEYHLYHRTLLRDVRLVYAPPRSVGEFGGETDNWEWPRQTGDFTMFRAYAAPGGKPRAFDPANEPYKPAHWLKVSPTGIADGELVCVLGYPGRTERYLTSTAVRDRESAFYPLRHDILTKMIDVLEKASVGNEKRALELSTTIKSLANVQKNALGMVKGLARNGTVRHKLDEEQAFARWVSESEERATHFGTALADMTAIDEEARLSTSRDLVLSLTMGRNVGLFRVLVNLAAAAEHLKGAPQPSALREEAAAEAATRYLDEVQAPTLAILIDAMRALPEGQRISGMEPFAAEMGDARPLVAAALKDLSFKAPAARGALLAKGDDGAKAMAEFAKSAEPLVVLARGVAHDRAAMIERLQRLEGRRLVAGPRWIEAQQEWRGKTFYPDANGTLRVSLATVKGYAPRDGVWYPPHTTVAGILEKGTGKEPFEVPERLSAAAKTRAQSRFVDKRLGDVPVCFLADADTTGGNSGSPVINGRGEFVGINFDRVFENVSGDFGWAPERSRNVSVDVRYILWFLESVIPAPHLLKEMGVG